MAEIKLTKGELRIQQQRLGQLDKYLPTLQLKKALLQLEVNEAKVAIEELQNLLMQQRETMEKYRMLIGDRTAFDPKAAAKVVVVERQYENIAGVEVPLYVGVQFEKYEYALFETPPWVDGAVVGVRKAVEIELQIQIGEEKRDALEKELREVSIRVNLFEKILIPRAKANIKKIRVFLGDQQLAAVSQGKVAKTKILEREEAERRNDAH